MGKRHGPEEIIGKLREAEIVLAQGGTASDACRRIGVSEQTYYRWRKEFGGRHTPIQRCQVHKARNIVERLPKPTAFAQSCTAVSSGTMSATR